MLNECLRSASEMNAFGGSYIIQGLILTGSPDSLGRILYTRLCKPNLKNKAVIAGYTPQLGSRESVIMLVKSTRNIRRCVQSCEKRKRKPVFCRSGPVFTANVHICAPFFCSEMPLDGTSDMQAINNQYVFALQAMLIQRFDLSIITPQICLLLFALKKSIEGGGRGSRGKTTFCLSLTGKVQLKHE